ncbi:hypothetical protein GCM10008096_24850 [Zhihengliuella salsuginis]|uniref:PknH-like extracellular domain-containing protein n=2 Tax=Zhihengliuella salsuginis TaxID=578222 RepID=A0ABQ3GL31_9MICC|nr:hypothetical protein GCM10008096_24850 [Zhihengliuella salsuginis]
MTARPSRRRTRPRAFCAAAGALLLALAGCSGPGGDAPPTGQAAQSSDAGAPSTAGPTPSETPPAWDDAGDLPSADLESSAYEGGPRAVGEVFHAACVRAVDGDDLPETTDAAEERTAVAIQSTRQLTEGWKACPTQVYESFAVPASFTVENRGQGVGDGAVDRLDIRDGSGEPVGGFVAVNQSPTPESAELVETLEITELEASPVSEEVRYVRTLLVEAGSGPQLLIDQVSAPAGTDPASLEVWDLAAGPDSRALVYASIRLDDAEQGGEAAESELAAVLQAMVGSFEPSVQYPGPILRENRGGS